MTRIEKVSFSFYSNILASNIKNKQIFILTGVLIKSPKDILKYLKFSII